MNASQIEVSQLWGDSLLRVERYSRWKRLTVGPMANSDFVAEGDAPSILVDGGAVQSDAGAVEITADTDVLIDVGEQTFRIRAVPEEPRVGGAFFAHVDWFFIGVLLVGMVALILGTALTLLALVLWVLFKVLLAFVLSLFALTPPAFLQLPQAPVPTPVVVATAKIAPAAPSGTPSKLFMLHEELPARPKPAVLEPIPIGDILSKKIAAPKKRNTIAKDLDEMEFALLGVLRSDDAKISSVFGSGGLGTGISDSLGGLRGEDLSYGGGLVGTGTGSGGGGTAVGIGGLGVRGSGGGGGGGTLGMGTIGTGRGRAGIVPKKIEPPEEPDYVDYVEESDDEEGGIEGGVVGGVVGGVEGGVAGGVVGGVLGGRAMPPPPPPPPTAGTLSAQQIRRGIDSRLSQVRECYEKELASHPTLAGRVIVRLRIGPDGAVDSAQLLSSMNPRVDGCVLTELRAVRFDEPEGGAVTVTYPFVFKAANQ